jgi:DNA repair and recombination RAD54-like protein
LVSNFTETLDIFARMLACLGAKYVRLDGGVQVNKRQRLVDAFNLSSGGVFAFLLSSKAGGCGLNLIGGNRLILFDPSWNPADDRQAAARIWRDGQKRTCYIYRLLATGSIEEKIFQRQVTKENLSSLVMEDDIAGESSISQNDVRRLFEFQESTKSDTHDMLHCKGCRSRANHWLLHPRGNGYKPQDSGANDADLIRWAHHAQLQTVDDPLLKKCGQKHVSYTFSLECQND